jgi:hypothetical protein
MKRTRQRKKNQYRDERQEEPQPHHNPDQFLNIYCAVALFTTHNVLLVIINFILLVDLLQAMSLSYF